MGYNTVVLVLNDQLDRLEADPAAFVEHVKHGYKAPDFVGRDGRNYLTGVSGPGQATVLHPFHADHLQVIVAGGNMMMRIPAFDPGDDLLDLLEERARFAKEQAERCLKAIKKRREGG